MNLVTQHLYLKTAPPNCFFSLLNYLVCLKSIENKMAITIGTKTNIGAHQYCSVRSAKCPYLPVKFNTSVQMFQPKYSLKILLRGSIFHFGPIIT